MAVTEKQRAGWRGFGVAGAMPLEMIRVLAPAAEAAGYHTFWVNDTPTGDGLAALRAAADVTWSIHLGIGVIPLDRQPAAQVAKRVKELALPQDRLFLGVGSGDSRGALQRVWDATQELENALSAVIIVGALGPKMCGVAGGGADGVLLNWLTPEYVAPSAAFVDEAAAEAKRARPLIMGYVRTALGPAAREVFVREAARYGSYPSYADNFTRMGAAPEEVVVAGDTTAEVQAGLARYAAVLDETVVRAITGQETVADYLTLLEAAAPAK